MTATRAKTPLHIRLRRARERAGLTQTEAARQAGTHQAAVSQIETGARSTPRIEAKLARALGVEASLDELFGLGKGRS
jgi:transcriptional regulator with XRE-family HTH domain